MLPDVQRLAADIESSNPTDPEQQRRLLQRIESMRGDLQRAEAQDLAAYLDSAVDMIQYVIQMGRMGPEQVLGIAAGLVRKIETSFENGQAEEEAARAQPTVADVRPGPLPAPETPALHDAGGLRLPSVAEERMLGEVMLQLGFVTRKQLELGLVTQRATDMRIGEALVSVGAATWDQVKEAIAVQERLRPKSSTLSLKRP